MIINDDNENEPKEEENTDIIQISLNIDEEKYIIKIYSSKDHATIIFKIEQENIQTYYFYEKFDLRDFKQKYKQFTPNNSIQEVFNTLKQMIEKSTTKLEKKSLKMNISFLNESETIATFCLKKKIVSQNRLNPLLVEQIQDNKSKIKDLKKQAIKFDKLIQNQNDIINNINNKIDTINNNINNIINDINNINNTIKNSIKIEEQKIIDDNKNNIQFKSYSNTNIIKTKKGEKDKKKNQNNKNNKNDNKKEIINENKEDNIIENKEKEEIKGNKIFNINNSKLFYGQFNYFLIAINVITLIFMIHLLYIFFLLKNDFNYEKLKEENFRKKLEIFNFLDDLNDKDLESLEQYIKIQNYIKNNNKTNNNINNNININNYKVKIKPDNRPNTSKEIKNQNKNPPKNGKNEKNIANNNQNNISYKSFSNEKKDINNSIKDKASNENNMDKKQHYLLETDEEIKYFKNKIKLKTPYKIKDVNFVLKYKSSSSQYKEFYNNCRGISENLIILKSKDGKKVGIFSKNIIDILNNINKTKDFLIKDSNFIGYIFGSENIDEIYFQDFIGIYNIFVSIFKDIYNFLDKKIDVIDRKNINMIEKKFDNKDDYSGNIDEIEIYQIKYLIK